MPENTPEKHVLAQKMTQPSNYRQLQVIKFLGELEQCIKHVRCALPSGNTIVELPPKSNENCIMTSLEEETNRVKALRGLADIIFKKPTPLEQARSIVMSEPPANVRDLGYAPL